MAELSGTTLGFEVGFALGQVNDEKSLHVPDTQLLFCTYGYALRSGLINRARTLVLDEVHEGMSIFPSPVQYCTSANNASRTYAF